MLLLNLNRFKIISIFIALALGSSSQAQELKMISGDSYIAEYPSSERKAIVKFLEHQFDHWKKPITQQSLDEFWNSEHDMLRFQIIDQKLYAKVSEGDEGRVLSMFVIVKNSLEKLLKHYHVDNVDFIIWHNEKLKKIVNYPFFLMSKSNSIYDQGKFLFPDTYMLESWQQLADNLKNAGLQYPWTNKINKIYWRGLNTASLSDFPDKQEGPINYNIESFDKIPRLSLVMLSILYPDLIDAKFSAYISNPDLQKNIELESILNKLNAIGGGTSEANHLKYKYLISVDGNTCAWKRPVWIMYSNSVLVKEESHLIEWFYPAIKPYVHYVPVNEKLTNMFSQLEWMKNHDDQVKQISDNAHNFVQHDLMPEHIEAHIAILLNSYANLHNNQQILATLPEAEVTLAHVKNKSKSKFVQMRNYVLNGIKEYWNSLNKL